ncbi:MAG TPA: hypothetical protein VEL74_04865 [Thermoanaerobaculia bacterium]|nr:hypothetical protein [Thermoanaerobaculia bacterium]
MMSLRALIAVLITFSGAPLLAAEQGKPAAAPAVRLFTTAQLAGWLCKALPSNDGRKLAATLFDGKLPGEETDKGYWQVSLMEDGKDLIDVNFMGMELMEDVASWVLTLELEGNWHGISEADWLALAQRVRGRTEKGDHRGTKICAAEKKSCRQLGGYEVGPGVRWLQLVWGSSDPNPSTWFCAKG